MKKTMKKTMFAVLLMVLFITGISSCTQYIAVEPNGTQKALTSAETPDKSNTQTASPVAEEPTAGLDETVDIKTDSGRYAGQADSNFIEIKISGVPDDNSAKAFMLSEEIKNNFSNLGLETGDNIKFEYYINKNLQNVIVSIKKI